MSLHWLCFAAFPSAIRQGYTYLDGRDGARDVVAPMHFDNRETALASACALLRAGFAVSMVTA
jgi:hypothetical protein